MRETGTYRDATRPKKNNMSRGPNNSLPVPRRNVTYGEQAGSHFPPVSASHENDYDDESFNFSQKPRQARGGVGGWGGRRRKG